MKCLLTLGILVACTAPVMALTSVCRGSRTVESPRSTVCTIRNRVEAGQRYLYISTSTSCQSKNHMRCKLYRHGCVFQISLELRGSRAKRACVEPGKAGAHPDERYDSATP